MTVEECAALNGLTVLILEDEMIIALALEETLLKGGAGKLKIAMNLAEARSFLAENTVDAAVLDLRLPDGDSTQLGAELVAQNVAVVIHSGHAELAHINAIPGAINCPKPATHRAIVSSVQEAHSLTKSALNA